MTSNWMFVFGLLQALFLLMLGVIGYFLRRLLNDFDAVRAAQLRTETRLTNLEGSGQAQSREILRVDQEVAGCRRQHDSRTEELRRDMAEVRGMLVGLGRDQAGVLAALHAVDTRLQEGNGRFGQHEEMARDHEKRLGRLEGRTE